MGHNSASCLLHSGILAHESSPIWVVAHVMERTKEMMNDKLALTVSTHIKLTKARHVAIPDLNRTGMCNSPTRRDSDDFEP